MELTEKENIFQELNGEELDERIKNLLSENISVVNPVQQPEYSLFPCMRISDKRNFLCLYSLNANKWFVFDKISLALIDFTETDSFRFEFSVLDSGPEYKVRYECNDNDDFWGKDEMLEIRETVTKTAMNFNESEWNKIRENDEDARDVRIDNESVEAQDEDEVVNYRYENFVLKKFKKPYIGKVIKITKGDRIRYVKVEDFNIESGKKNTLARLNVSGQTIDIDSAPGYVKCRFSDYNVSEQSNVIHFIGYIDEFLIRMKHGRPYVPFDVISNEDTSELFSEVRKEINTRFERFINELDNNRKLFKEKEDKTEA